MHIDFLQLVDGAKLNVEIPIRFIGVAPGTKAGGKLTQKLRRVSKQRGPDEEQLAEAKKVFSSIHPKKRKKNHRANLHDIAYQEN